MGKSVHLFAGTVSCSSGSLCPARGQAELAQCLLNDRTLEGTEVNKQGLDKKRQAHLSQLTDLGHDRGSNGASWGIRRERPPFCWRGKGRGNRGRLERAGDNGGAQTFTVIQQVLSKDPLYVRSCTRVGAARPCLSASWALLDAELFLGTTHPSYDSPRTQGREYSGRE